MQYSDTTTKGGIIQMIENTTSLGDATITGNTVKFAYFNVLVNDFYRMAAFLAWRNDKTWVFDDINHTTFPQATTDLVNNQRDYALPATALKIRQVEILDSSGQYYSLKFISEEDPVLLTDKEGEQAGIPWGYRLVANSIKLYPVVNTANVTATAGLRITIDREIDSFTVSDTTQEPGLSKAMQPILYYGPSFVWASINSVDAVSKLCERMLGKFPGLTEMLEDYYSQRNEKPRVIKRAYQTYK